MINRILVCLDKSTYTDAAIDYAAGWPGITTRRWKVWWCWMWRALKDLWVLCRWGR